MDGDVREVRYFPINVEHMFTVDLQQFRQALAELQRQVDELDAIKAEYHEEVLEGEDEVCRVLCCPGKSSNHRSGTRSWVKSHLSCVVNWTSTRKSPERRAIRYWNRSFLRSLILSIPTVHPKKKVKSSVYSLRKSPSRSLQSQSRLPKSWSSRYIT